jgi:hypothetical protein
MSQVCWISGHTQAIWKGSRRVVDVEMISVSQKVVFKMKKKKKFTERDDNLKKIRYDEQARDYVTRRSRGRCWFGNCPACPWHARITVEGACHFEHT